MTRRASAGARLRYRAEYVVVRAVSWAIGWLPMAAVRAAGMTLGRIAGGLDAGHRRVAEENLRHAFPDRTDGERCAIARGMFRHFGALLLELLRFGDLSPAGMRTLADVEGAEHVRRAYAAGRGVLFFTGHFGYWEMQALAQALWDRPMAVLARPLDNPDLDDMLTRIRTRTGNTVIARQGAIRKVLRELAGNGGVAILIDQHLHTADAVSVDFFGRPAATTSALAALALRTGAALIPAFARPLPGGRYQFVYEPAVDVRVEPGDDPVLLLTQRCTAVLEARIREEPALWLWMHRRWRETPPLSPAGRGEPGATVRNDDADA